MDEDLRVVGRKVVCPGCESMLRANEERRGIFIARSSRPVVTLVYKWDGGEVMLSSIEGMS
jgi:hypothetical protein